MSRKGSFAHFVSGCVQFGPMKVSGTDLWTFDNCNVSMVSFSKNKAKNMEETTTLSFMEV